MLQREAEQLQRQVEQLAQQQQAPAGSARVLRVRRVLKVRRVRKVLRVRKVHRVRRVRKVRRVRRASLPPTRARGPRSRRRNRRSIVCDRRRRRCGARRPIRVRRPTRVWPPNGSARRAVCSAACSRRSPTGRLGSISKEADRLAAEEKSEADRVAQAQGARGRCFDAARDIQQLADDRQRMADDLSNLQQDMRNAARELDAGQRAASEQAARGARRAWTRPTSKRACSARPTGFAAASTRTATAPRRKSRPACSV